MDINLINAGIIDRSLVIGVIGLGYVGLPVACLLADAGFKVIGIDVKEDRVNEINRGISPIQGIESGLQDLLASVIERKKLHATVDPAELSSTGIVFVNVETPVEEDHKPLYVAMRAACNSLGKHIQTGTLVIIESTIAPGTTRNVIVPEIEKSSGKKLNKEFFLGVCPERVMPGKLLQNLRTMSRVCGGSTIEVARVMKSLYSTIVKADIDTSDIITAELVKTAENTYRDVQIAFANELALICEEYGADVYEVRELVNKSPNRQVHMPGVGVGGHCIPKDPWLLVASMPDSCPIRLIPSAREVNTSMPHHVFEKLVSMLSTHNRSLKDSRIVVLGLAYLENSDDTRNSPSEVLINELNSAGAKVTVNDPFVPGYDNEIIDAVKDSDAIVLLVAHDNYRQLDLQAIRKKARTPILIDGRHVFQKDSVLKLGFDYYCVGIGDGD